MKDLYAPLCRGLVLPLWFRRRKSRVFEHLRYLERSQYFPADQVREIQLGKIRGILAHAGRNCPYYREAFGAAGVEPGEIGSFKDFLRVPLLRKTDVQRNASSLLAENVRPYSFYLTSGSTGTPIKGCWDSESEDFKRGCGARSDRWAGHDFGERAYCLYGNPERELRGWNRLKARLRRKLIHRVEILDMLNLSEAAMQDFARKMRRKPPSLLWGHAHGLYLLATYLDRTGVRDIRPRGMYSAGMVLHETERAVVERVFGCVLQDRYGCEELGMIAAECKAREGLHINTDDLYVEFLGPDGKPVAPGERGAVVVTDLSNRAMPLIRYRMEDIAVPSARACSCGRTQPLIERVEGRVADFLLTPEGKLVSGISLTDHFAGQIPGIAQMQILQETRDELTLRVVKGPDFGMESERRVGALVREFFGERMRYRFEFLGEIPRGATGKFRFTICTVKHELL